MNCALHFVFLWLLPGAVLLLGSFNYYFDYLQALLGLEAPLDGQVFDFVIVGAGSAGSVIASRLSSNPRISILVLEAGTYPIAPMQVPGFAWNLIHDPSHDFAYTTSPQVDACQAAKERRCSVPRGKVIGGSSALNLMQYVRGHPLDYDAWANATEDDSWSYTRLLPYFKRSLDYHGAFEDNQDHYGGGGGPLHVESRRWTQVDLRDAFFNAGKQLGYDAGGRVDLNGPQRLGFGPAEFTTRDGRRQDTFTAFLAPILGKRTGNLRISTYSLAKKIHLDREKRARAVTFERHGRRYKVWARREIIISAGAIDSPKLLLLSGIGGKQQLKDAGILPVLDLPGVGSNLQDHVGVPIGPFLINRTGASYIPERDFGWNSLLEDFTGGGGVLSSSACTAGQAFVHSSGSKSESEWPDLQLYMLSVGTSPSLPASLSLAYGIPLPQLESFLSPHYGNDSFMILVALTRPQSVGTLTLQQNNPIGAPVIDPRLLQQPVDRDALLRGVRFVLRLVRETHAFQKLGADLISNPWPTCAPHAPESDDYWRCYISELSVAFFHPVGTCKMGRNPMEGGVVDSKLRVHGVKGLRVADASIMPQIVNGNTNAPCIMIGERAADIIREYWAEQTAVCDRATFYFGKLAKFGNYQCFYSFLF